MSCSQCSQPGIGALWKHYSFSIWTLPLAWLYWTQQPKTNLSVIWEISLIALHLIIPIWMKNSSLIKFSHWDILPKIKMIYFHLPTQYGAILISTGQLLPPPPNLRTMINFEGVQTSTSHDKKLSFWLLLPLPPPWSHDLWTSPIAQNHYALFCMDAENCY